MNGRSDAAVMRSRRVTSLGVMDGGRTGAFGVGYGGGPELRKIGAAVGSSSMAGMID